MSKAFIVTLSVIMSLAIIIGLYIYVGMQFASQQTVSNYIEQPIYSDENEGQTMLERLQKTGAMTPEEREIMLERLRNAN